MAIAPPAPPASQDPFYRRWYNAAAASRPVALVSGTVNLVKGAVHAGSTLVKGTVAAAAAAPGAVRYGAEQTVEKAQQLKRLLDMTPTPVKKMGCAYLGTSLVAGNWLAVPVAGYVGWKSTPTWGKWMIAYLSPLPVGMPLMAKLAYDAVTSSEAKEAVTGYAAAASVNLAVGANMAADATRGAMEVAQATLPTGAAVASAGAAAARGTLQMAQGALQTGAAVASALGSAAVSAGVSTAKAAVAVLPSKEAVVHTAAQLVADPSGKTALAVAKRVIATTHPALQAAAALALPAVAAPFAFAAVAYNALPETGQAAVRETAERAVEAFADQVPAAAPVAQRVHAAVKNAVGAVQGPIVVAGRDINPRRITGEDTSIPLTDMAHRMAETGEEISTAALAAGLELPLSPVDEEDAASASAQQEGDAANAAQAAAEAPAAVDPLLEDKGATEATGPQARAAAEDWKAKSDKVFESVSEHTADFATLAYMYYNICGMHKKKNEQKNPTLYELVRKASVPSNEKKPNLSDLFISKYNIKFFSFNWWRCKMFDIFICRTSILPKFLAVNIKSRIEKLRSLDKDSDPEQAADINKLLTQANRLFKDLHKASGQQAQNKDKDLDTYWMRAIVSRYGQKRERIETDRALQVRLIRYKATSLWGKLTASQEFPSYDELERAGQEMAFENLCTRFMRRELSENFTYVPFFEKAPIYLKPFAKIVEWTLNGIIYIAMRYFILPNTFKTIVESSLNAIGPHHLPFSVPVTEFLASFFRNLQADLKKGGISKPIAPIAGTEKLPEVVESLRTLLNIMAKEEKIPVFKEEVKKAIEKGIIKAGHILFDYVTNPLNRDQLLHNLGQLLNKVYSGESPKTREDWEAKAIEFEQAQKNLLREANAAFDLIVEGAVKEELSNFRPEKGIELKNGAFEEQKQKVSTVFQKLERKFGLLRKKIEANSPDDRGSILPELRSVAKELKQFADAARALNEQAGLTPASKENISQALSPIYRKMNSMSEHVTALLTLQTKFTSHAQIKKEFNNVIKPQIALLGTDSASVGEQILPIRNCVKRLQGHLPPDASELRHLNELIQQLSSKDQEHPALLDKIERGHKKAQALLALGATGDQGLLHQLALYAKNSKNPATMRRHFPNGFVLSKLLGSIKEEIAQLAPDDQAEIHRYVEEITQFAERPVGSFDRYWTPLWSKLTDLHKTNSDQNEKLTQELDTTKARYQSWVEQKISAHAEKKDGNHNEMLENLEALEEILGELQGTIPTVALQAQTHLTPDELKYVTGAFGALIGLLCGAPTGAAVGAAACLGVRGLSTLATTGSAMTAATVAAGATLAGATAQVLPGVIGVAAGTYGAATAGAEAEGHGSKMTVTDVVAEVMVLFDGAFKLFLSPLLAHAVATWTMQEVVESKPNQPSLIQQPLISVVG